VKTGVVSASVTSAVSGVFGVAVGGTVVTSPSLPVSAQETKAHEVKRIKQIKKSEVNLNEVIFITDLSKSKFQHVQWVDVIIIHTF
jgi:hypothetical protein